MEITYLSTYDRHCLDKLIGTSTEDRLRAEGHVFTLTDGTEYEREGKILFLLAADAPTDGVNP
jgi:hypothetical protein